MHQRGSRAHRCSHLNSTISARNLLPNKVTFAGAGGRDFHMCRAGTQCHPRQTPFPGRAPAAGGHAGLRRVAVTPTPDCDDRSRCRLLLHSHPLAAEALTLLRACACREAGRPSCVNRAHDRRNDPKVASPAHEPSSVDPRVCAGELGFPPPSRERKCFLWISPFVTPSGSFLLGACL